MSIFETPNGGQEENIVEGEISSGGTDAAFVNNTILSPETVEVIKEKGVVRIQTGATDFMMEERGTKGGFQILNMGGVSPNDLDEIYREWHLNQNINQVVQESGVDATLVIKPIYKESPVYEEKVVEKEEGGWFGKKKVSQTEQVFSGMKRETLKFNKIKRDDSSDEDAYLISHLVVDSEDNHFFDPTTNRTGNLFRGDIILPASEARKLFEELKNNPDRVRDVFNVVDSELMGDLENHIPKSRHIAIQGEGEDMFDKYPSGAPKSIKNEFVIQLL